MPSPFPGMDPYIEDPAIWEDFHSLRPTPTCRSIWAKRFGLFTTMRPTICGLTTANRRRRPTLRRKTPIGSVRVCARRVRVRLKSII